ncbi:MAG: hypothetical protein ACYCR7_01190 [Thermoplasmataceae archaeon]
MKISEIHTKLNRRCTIAIRQHSGIFGLLSRTEEVVPAYVFMEDDKTYLQMYFRKTAKPNTALSPILSRKDLVEKRSYYSISERINNIDGMKIISEVLETPSVALNNTYIFKDELYIDFRFHSSMLHEINDILARVIGKSSNFRIARFTGARSIRDRMQEMNLQEPISVVRYSVPLPEDNELIEYMADKHPDAVAEIESRALSDEGIKVLLYTENLLDHEGVRTISRTDNIYETYVSEKSLVEGRKRGNEARIPRIAFFLTIEDGRLMDTTFVPAAEADEYISIMMSMFLDDHSPHPLFEYYSVLDDEAWNWL